jgi:hypothetical protein
MDSHTISTWLQSKESRPYGAVKEQVEIFRTLFDSKISPSDAATAFLHQVQASKHQDAAWRFHQVLFAVAAELPRLHPVLIQLVQAIQLVPPRPELPNDLDINFWSDWGDMHSYLWGRRMLASGGTDDLRASTDISNAERDCNFIIFSANILKDADDHFGGAATAFFDIRDALEVSERRWPEHSILSEQQVRGLDVEVAALWIVHGRDCLLRVRNADFDEGWKAGLAKKTDLWQGEPGVSAERWVLWERELRWWASSGGLDDRRGELALKAATTISNR